MSDAIRCGQCRWWELEGDESEYGHCHLNPPVYTGGAPLESTNWYQPVTHFRDYCSRGERKTEASNLTVSDGDPLAMVDGLPVFRAKLTEEQP